MGAARALAGRPGDATEPAEQRARGADARRDQAPHRTGAGEGSRARHPPLRGSDDRLPAGRALWAAVVGRGPRRGVSSWSVGRSPISRGGSSSGRPRPAISGRWHSTRPRSPSSSSSGSGRRSLRRTRASSLDPDAYLWSSSPDGFVTAPSGWRHLPVHRSAQRSRVDAHPSPSPPPFRRHGDVGRRRRRPHRRRQARALSSDSDLADVRARHGRHRSQGRRGRRWKHLRNPGLDGISGS